MKMKRKFEQIHSNDVCVKVEINLNNLFKNNSFMLPFNEFILEALSPLTIYCVEEGGLLNFLFLHK